MCCCCLPRCSIIFGGVWCLIQGVAWMIAALIGFFVYTCDIRFDFDMYNPSHYLYFFYFFNRDCADIPHQLEVSKILGNSSNIPFDFATPDVNFTTPDVNFTTPDVNSTPDNWTTLSPFTVWPERFVQADYTHTLMKFYIGFNAAWVITCCIIIVAAAARVSNWCAYVPWILVTAANIVLDVIATIQFSNDATNSQTLQGVLQTVIGMDPFYIHEYGDRFYDMPFFRYWEGFTMMPSIVMAFATSRLGIVGLLNVVSLICVFASIPQLSTK